MDTTGRLESARELATATEWLAVLATRQEGGLVVWAAQAADQRRRRAGGAAADRVRRQRSERPGTDCDRSTPGRFAYCYQQSNWSANICAAETDPETDDWLGFRLLRVLAWPKRSASWAPPALR